MISVNNVSVVFGGWYLLDGVSFLINKKDRIGLTGRNGAGKSTTLKMLAGLQQPTEGSISMPAGLRIGYLPQAKAYTDGNTVREEAQKAFADLFALRDEAARLGEQLAARTDYDSPDYLKLLDKICELTELLTMRGEGNMEKETEVVLKGLGFRTEDLGRQCGEFSGGWRMRIELAKILLSRPDVFLLDEPTNHLDIESITWLESFLQAYPGAVVLVSHDRAFLDDLVDRVLEIRDGSVYDYPGNYSWFIEKRAEREARAAAERAGEAQPEKAESKTKEQKRAEAEERNRLYRAKKGFVDRLKAVEEEISKGEARKTEINELLCSQEVLSDSGRIQELMIELKEKENSLKALYDEWEELSLKIEEIK